MSEAMGEKPPIKPGYKTTEFWLSVLAIVVGGLVSSGAFVEGPFAQVLGVVQSTLVALGYTVARGLAKRP
jgi:hypothetical protein